MAAFALQAKQPSMDLRFSVAADAISGGAAKDLLAMAIFAGNLSVLPIQCKKLIVIEIRQASGAIVTGDAIEAELLLVFSHKNWFSLLMAGSALL